MSKFSLSITSAILAVPLASAQYRFDFIGLDSMMQNVMDMITDIFGFSLQTEQAFVGFGRFLFFILFLALFQSGLKKGAKLEHRTAGIVATVLALGATFLSPEQWILAYGGIIVGAVYLAVFGTGIWYGFWHLRDHWGKHLLGLGILLGLLFLNTVFYETIAGPATFSSILEILVGFVGSVLFILAVIKALWTLGSVISGVSFGNWRNPFRRDKRNDRGEGERLEEAETETTEEGPNTGTLRVRVTNALTGRQVPNAIIGRIERRRMRRDNHYRIGHTEDNGIGDITMEQGTYEVIAGAPGYISVSSRNVRIEADRATEVELLVYPNAELRVVDLDERDGTLFVRVRAGVI